MKRMWRILTLTIVASILASLVGFTAQAKAFPHSIPLEDELIAALDQKINAIVEADSELCGEFEITEVKILLDFAGNMYYDIECIPTGYLIYHVASGNFAEYSLYSPSPYRGLEGELYYGGMTEYYYYENGIFSHTITGETFRENSEAVDAFCESCSEADLKMQQDGESVELATASAESVTWLVSGSSFISELSKKCDFGYYYDGKSAGNCGYVAAALLLFYYDCVASDGFVSDAQYLNIEGNAYRGESRGMQTIGEYNNLAKHLFLSFGKVHNAYWSDTAGTQYDLVGLRGIDEVIGGYCEVDTDVEIDATGETCLSFDAIFDLLKRNKHPIIVFGKFDDNGQKKVGHAVVAYGYKTSGSAKELIVHYGWGGYSKVTVNSSMVAVGSYYMINEYTRSDQCEKFSDIKYHWAKKYISNCINNDCMSNGMTETSFGPSSRVSRGMLAEILYRLAGSPPQAINHPFTDVPNSTYYAKAVSWAYQNEIINGVTNTEFWPNTYVTREQAITMIYRFSNFQNYQLVLDSVSSSSFADYSSVSGYAKASVNWGLGTGILNGTKVGSSFYLYPKKQIIRCEIAKIIFMLERKAGVWQ